MNRTSRNTKIGLIMMFFLVAALIAFYDEKCENSYCDEKIEDESDHWDRLKYLGYEFGYEQVESDGSETSSSSSSSETTNSSSLSSPSNSSSSSSYSNSSSFSSSSKKPSYSSSSKKSYYSSYNSYDDGYEDVYEDDDYDWDRYYSDDEYAAGVDDAMDELDW